MMSSEHEAATMIRTHQAASASVALDVGHGCGALVIYPDDRYRGREIEISRPGEEGRRVHTGVHDRRTRVGSVLTAIFGRLEAGEYVVWADDRTVGPRVTVADGGVTEIRLS